MEQITINPLERWFNTPDANTLCRAGGNGPFHPSQMYAITKYVHDGMTLLDYGAGSATTYEAIITAGTPKVVYKGVDIIPKNVDFCKQTYPEGNFELYETEEIEEPNQSFDVVFSRHVVDHMRSFEMGLNEHCRVAKKLVIIVLWVPVSNQEEHQIKPIIDNGKTYSDEFTNCYSKKKIFEAIKAKEDQGWKLEEFTEDVGSDVKGHDTVIVLSKK
jgi:ubiquinone/menaquinone biosynthesis C-methylase UbiE